MATKEMSIKLMIDPESNRLIFAEASKDFVDFLIYILSLPIGTVTNLLSDESMVGSIGNVYASVSNLDVTYLQPDVDKFDILNPSVIPSAIKTPLYLTRTSINNPCNFYTCSDPKCKSGITNVYWGVRCPGCGKDMYNKIEFIDKHSEGYVQSAVSYMVSDDLSITSISTMSIVSMLNKFTVTKPEERVVKIGNEEALELLNASLESTTVLTDVFLKNKKRKKPGKERKNVQISVNLMTGNTIYFSVHPNVGIYKIMTVIEEREGVPPKNQALLFRGRRLHPERTFADYNLVDGTVIDLFIHQSGC